MLEINYYIKRCFWSESIFKLLLLFFFRCRPAKIKRRHEALQNIFFFFLIHLFYLYSFGYGIKIHLVLFTSLQSALSVFNAYFIWYIHYRSCFFGGFFLDRPCVSPERWTGREPQRMMGSGRMEKAENADHVGHLSATTPPPRTTSLTLLILCWS